MALSPSKSNRAPVEKELPKESMLIIVGPVIGKVTSTTARVLVEVDITAEIECVLSTAAGQTFSQKKNLRRRIPQAFSFSDLPPATLFTVKFPQVLYSQSREGTFRTLPAKVVELKVASFSCNSMGEPEEPVVWDVLLNRYVAKKNVDYALHVGDQVYADHAFSAGVKLLKTHFPKDFHPDHVTPDIRTKISEEYQKVYRETWNYPPTKNVLANVPNFMIWDDHDVRDDWGTHSTDSDPSSYEYVVGQEAWKVYKMYQRQMWDDVFDEKGEIKAVQTEGSFHVFGEVGIMIIDTRGARSFLRDQERPFVTKYQWDKIVDNLKNGPFTDVRCLIVVMSVALCCCGPEMSKTASHIFPKDKMGFGLFPKEQLDCLTVFHEWLEAKPKGQRSMVLIGGDLHMAIRTEIYHNDRLLWEQYITSPMRHHPPPNVAFVGMKGAMLFEEKLPQGYHFQHTMIEPCRNFGIIYAECFPESDANVRCHLYLHGNDDMFGNSPYQPGELLVRDITATGITAGDVYAKVGVLKQEQKTDKTAENVKKLGDIRFELEKGQFSSDKPELSIKLFQHNTVIDTKLTTSTIPLSDIMTPKLTMSKETGEATGPRIRNESFNLPVSYKGQTGHVSFTVSWRPWYVDG